MADVSAGSVSYQFKADVSDFQAGMKQVQDDLRNAGQQASEAASKISKELNSASKAANDNTGAVKLNRMQWMELSAAVRHSIDALAAGASPMRVLAMEGTKASAVFSSGTGGVAGTMRALVGAINPVTAAIVAATAAIAGIIIVGKQWSDEYQKLEKVAKVTTLAIGDLMRMQQIADRGLEKFDVNKGMTEFAKNLREAQVAGGDMAELLKKNGIAITDAAGRARPLKDVFVDVAKLISSANNEVDKMKFAEKMGIGADGVEFMERYTKAIRDGNDQLTEGEKRIIEYKKKAAEFDKAWQDIWEGFVRRVKSAMYDGIIAVIDFTKSAIDATVNAYNKMKQATIELMANIVGLFQGTKAAIVAAWSNLPAAFELLAKSIYNGFVQAIQDALNTVIGLVNRAADFIRSIPGMLANVWKTIVDSVTSFIQQAVSTISQWLVKIPDLLAELGSNIASLFQKLLQAVSDIWSNLPTILENFAKMAVNKLVEIVQNGLNIMVSAFNQVLGLFNGGKLSEINLDGAKLTLSADAQDMGKKITESFTQGLQQGRAKVQATYKDVLDPPKTAGAQVDSISKNAEKTIKGLYDKKDGGGAKEGLDTIQRYIEQLRLATAEARLEVEYFGKSNQEKQIAINLEKLNTAAKKAGRDATEEEKQAVIDTTKELVKQQDLLQKMKDIKQATQALADAFTDALDSWIVKGEKFNSVLKNMLQSLSSMALKAVFSGTGPFAGIMGTANGGGFFNNILGSLFSGFRASGGDVMGGKAYVVGEKGPELFIPGADGGIVSNDNLRGGGRGQTINFNVTSPDAGSFARSEQQISAMLARAVKRGQRSM
ncbi:MAG: hypothetical protein CGW95_01125 [Phenylobacterium zucineum]|nr:MAG: hypothetical protein CGW95_01125 [Phenylobacterium zucineum]